MNLLLISFYRKIRGKRSCRPCRISRRGRREAQGAGESVPEPYDCRRGPAVEVYTEIDLISAGGDLREHKIRTFLKGRAAGEPCPPGKLNGKEAAAPGPPEDEPGLSYSRKKLGLLSLRRLRAEPALTPQAFGPALLIRIEVLSVLDQQVEPAEEPLERFLPARKSAEAHLEADRTSGGHSLTVENGNGPDRGNPERPGPRTDDPVLDNHEAAESFAGFAAVEGGQVQPRTISGPGRVYIVLSEEDLILSQIQFYKRRAVVPGEEPSAGGAADIGLVIQRQRLEPPVVPPVSLIVDKEIAERDPLPLRQLPVIEFREIGGKIIVE